jgi:hypothetical protein
MNCIFLLSIINKEDRISFRSLTRVFYASLVFKPASDQLMAQFTPFLAVIKQRLVWLYDNPDMWGGLAGRIFNPFARV